MNAEEYKGFIRVFQRVQRIPRPFHYFQKAEQCPPAYELISIYQHLAVFINIEITILTAFILKEIVLFAQP
jgi:hypothetical protein